MSEKALTPMMDQYQQIKKENPDCLLFFRLGDFYEMFFEDAIIASRELELTLTGRSKGGNEKAPMCGVPYHSVENYIQRLVKKGYKVAICEQMEDPRLVKGLVKREITRIITPGTTMNAELPSGNNYIACIDRVENSIGFALCDITTGEFLVTELDDEDKLFSEIAKFSPSEILVNQEIEDMKGLSLTEVQEKLEIYVYPYGTHHFQYDRCKQTVLQQFGVMHLEGLGLENLDLGVTSSGALIDYLKETQKRELTHINQVRTYSVQDFMVLDMATRRNLELTETLRDKSYKGSLLWVIDQTKTAMGGRLLKRWLEQPLIRKESIDERLDCVEAMVNDPMISAELKEMLSAIYDMERLMGRVSYGSANARDMVALKTSLQALPGIKLALKDLEGRGFRKLEDELDTMEDIASLLEESINEEPPVSIREGDLIKKGYNEQVDRYRSAATEGKQWLADLEMKEKQETGIKNLKVGYNHVFGYYIEISKGQVSMAPDRYIRKQTLVNGERFITEELKQIEDTLLGAKEKGEALEYDLFCEIRKYVANAMTRIQKSADAVAKLDALRALADTAYRYHYVKPQILPPGGPIEITGGRHPVVEQMLPENAFIPNDTLLNMDTDRMAIITGPNMGGKSTYMRQVAAIALMAQIGSFVPAQAATISISDRIFTRVGASDDLSRGQSTFMVEMSEVSNILRHATKDSLLILDEIGRGTSTFDGLSLAWATVEYIADPKIIGAKTLFATHYHELTQLEEQLQGIRNYCVAIKQSGQDFIFLHKIYQGHGDQSYGIEVARLAGLPEWVLGRSHEILDHLLGDENNKKSETIQAKGVDASALSVADETAQQAIHEARNGQYSLLDEPVTGKGSRKGQNRPSEKVLSSGEKEVLEALKGTDVNYLTPLEAMQLLYDWKSKL